MSDGPPKSDRHRSPGWRTGHLTPEDRALLQLRARELARPQGTDASGGPEGVEVLELLSRGQRFALPLASVRSITELVSLAPLPRSPASLRGLVSVRGEVLVSVELGLLLGDTSGGIADLRRVIVVADEGRSLAVLAERIVGVMEVQTSTFAVAARANASFLEGTDEHLLSLLSIPRLIDHSFQLASGATP